MGLHKIQMPDIGEGITEAEIVEWECLGRGCDQGR